MHKKEFIINILLHISVIEYIEKESYLIELKKINYLFYPLIEIFFGVFIFYIFRHLAASVTIHKPVFFITITTRSTTKT